MDPMHEAACRGDVPGVQAALQAGVNPDLRDGLGFTALERAAEYGHAAVVGALVGGGAAVGVVNGYGVTALHIAARDGHAAAVEALVGAGAGVDAATKDGATPLSLAAKYGKTEAAAALLGAGADATPPTQEGKTAAKWARQKGHAAVARLIEAHLAQPESAAAPAPTQPAMSLHEATRRGDVPGVQANLQAGERDAAEAREGQEIFVREALAAAEENRRQKAERLKEEQEHLEKAKFVAMIEAQVANETRATAQAKKAKQSKHPPPELSGLAEGVPPQPTPAPAPTDSSRQQLAPPAGENLKALLEQLGCSALAGPLARLGVTRKEDIAGLTAEARAPLAAGVPHWAIENLWREVDKWRLHEPAFAEPKPEKGSESEPFAHLPMEQRKFDFFINHCQATGQDQCGRLALLMRARGWRVWYDMMAADLTAQGMEEGVANSRNVLVFLSDGLMSGPFCIKEQRWAVQYGCNFVGVAEFDYRHGGGKNAEGVDLFTRERAAAPVDLQFLFDQVEFEPFQRREDLAESMVTQLGKRGGCKDPDQSEPEPEPEEEPTEARRRARLAKARAEPEPEPQLERLRFHEIRRCAEVLGVDEDTLDDAEDEDSPKKFVMTIILDRLQALRSLRFKDLKQQVMRLGLVKEAIDVVLQGAEGAEARKAAVVAALLAQVVATAVAVTPSPRALSGTLLVDSLPEEPAECATLMQECVDEWQRGRWQLVELLGRGGGGVVYRAADRNLEVVAIKLTLMDPDRQRRAAREAVILQKVRHPHVCVILDNQPLTSRGVFAIVLELMNRGSLAARLESQGGRLEQREVVTVAFEVLQALVHVHSRGIIHRDVKPGNILRHRGEEGVVHKLGDFGIAVAGTKACGASTTLQTRTGGLQLEIGTPLYMSPEQLKKGVSPGPATDLWSTGVVMYQSLTGRMPFAHEEADDEMAIIAAIKRDEPTDPREVTEPGEVDDGVAKLVLSALRKPLDERFSSAAMMAAELEVALASTGSEDGFDIFINYRVWCEKDFAGELFKAAERLRIGTKQRRPVVYLDKVRLLDGQRFDIGFTIGLAQSLVFVPLLSANCLKPLANLGREDRADFVLVEYIMAFALYKRGIVKAILPVVLNEQEDGTHTEAFFQQLLSGAVAEGEPFPEAVSSMSVAKAAEFLSQLPGEHGGPIELTAAERAQTVKGIVAQLLCFQAALLHLDRAWDSGGELSKTSSIRGTHGGAGGAKAATRAAVIQKLAGRLIGAVEKCALAPPAAVAVTDGMEPEPELEELCASPTHGVTTPLHQASFRRDAAEVGRLLATVEGQGQISVTDVDGHTPLHKAAIYGEEETARLLVQRGAPLEAIDNAGATPLHLAAFEGEEMVVRLMLEAGASREAVGTRGDYQGRTPAAVAHFRGYAALATLLKPTLSDPAIANSTSAGSLHDAAESGDAAAVERLVRGGADVGVRATGGLRNLPYLPPGPELGPEPAPELELEPEPEAEAESEPEPEPTPLQLRVYDIPEEVQASTLKSKQG